MDSVVAGPGRTCSRGIAQFSPARKIELGFLPRSPALIYDGIVVEITAGTMPARKKKRPA